MKSSFLRLLDCLLIIALFFRGAMGHAALPEEFLYIPLWLGKAVVELNTGTHDMVTMDTEGESSSAVISPDGKFVYACTPRQNIITVIRTSDHSISTIAVGARPISLALTPDGKFLYVANENGDNVSVIDALKNIEITDNTTRIPVGNAPFTVAARPQGDIVYVVNRTAISVIWTWNNSVIDTITVTGSSDLSDLVFSPDGLYAYAVDRITADLFVINVRTRAVSSLKLSGIPWMITLAPDGQFAFVSSQTGTDIQAVLLSSTPVVSTITTSVTTNDGLATSPDGHFLYAADRGNPAVLSTIELLSQTEIVAARASAGYSPSRRIAITPSIPLINVTPHRTDSLVSTDFYNVITWNEPINPFPLHYKVYRDRALTQLLKSVPCSTGTDCQKICEEHSLLPGHTYNYYVVAENDYGIVSIGTASLTVHA